MGTQDGRIGDDAANGGAESTFGPNGRKAGVGAAEQQLLLLLEARVRQQCCCCCCCCC
jgi:hypothetical protein